MAISAITGRPPMSFSGSKSQLGRTVLKSVGLDQIPEHDRTVILIRHFDPYRRFSGNRGLDPDICSRQVQLDVVCKTDDLADLYTLLRLHFISCDRRSAAYIGNGHINAEVM